MSANLGCEEKKMLRRSEDVHARVVHFEELLSKTLIENARRLSRKIQLFSGE
jgi:hypothetical protein